MTPYLTELRNALERKSIQQSVECPLGNNLPNAGLGQDSCSCTVIKIDFEQNDPSDPPNWSPRHKWAIVVLISCNTAIVQLANVIAAPVAPQIMADFHSTNVQYRSLLVSIWLFGEIVGPLVCGPLSELYGRLPVFHTGIVLFILFSIGTALSRNIHMLIAFRFLTGMSAVSPALGPGVVGDLFTKKQRGKALSIQTLAGLLGPVIGPPIGSYLGQNVGWQWTIWLPTLLSASIFIPFVLLYRESYRKEILKRRAHKLREETNNPRIRSVYDEGVSTSQRFFEGMIRPLHLLVISPMLLLLTLVISFYCGTLYVVMTTMAPLFQDVYHFSEGAAGLAFLGLCIGMMLGTLFCGRVLDRYIQQKSDSGPMRPEQRLPPIIAAIVVLPAGLFVFGWTAYYKTHWMGPIIGTGVIGFGWPATSISIRSYIVDACGIYAVSATAGMLVLRNITAAALPLSGPPLYQNLGLGWGNSVLGFVAIAFVPVPVLLVKFGERIRKASRFGLVE